MKLCRLQFSGHVLATKDGITYSVRIRGVELVVWSDGETWHAKAMIPRSRNAITTNPAMTPHGALRLLGLELRGMHRHIGRLLGK